MTDKPVELLGYTVEKVGEEHNKAGYLLRNNRTAYTLMRRFRNKHNMYLLNSQFRMCSIKGHSNFRDKDGELVYTD